MILARTKSNQGGIETKFKVKTSLVFIADEIEPGWNWNTAKKYGFVDEIIDEIEPGWNWNYTHHQ